MICNELGRFPLAVGVQLRVIFYWSKLIIRKPSSIIVLCINCCNTCIVLKHYFKWLIFFKRTFDECGLSHIWNAQFVLNGVHGVRLRCNTKTRLCDKFKQTWDETIQDYSKAKNYRNVKICVFSRKF